MSSDAAESPSEVKLSDGRVVVVRALAEQDGPALTDFGTALRADDWRYLDLDLQNPATAQRLVTAHAATNWRQIVAVVEDRVVGYANVRLLPGWKSHVGDIHLVVDESVRGRGLGLILAEATVGAGKELGVAKLMLEMITEQAAGRKIFERLGFRAEGTLVRHARDDLGVEHDLLLLGLLLAE